MELDKRDVRAIADGRPHKILPLPRNLIIGGVVLIGMGFFIKNVGLAIAIAGVALFFIGNFLNERSRQKAIKEFQQNYEKTGVLPPYPEKKSKTQS